MLRNQYDQYYETFLRSLIDEYIKINNDVPERQFELKSHHPKDQIYEEYQNQKTLFRILYGKTVPTNEDAETEDKDRLCRHKVCACLTVSIVKCRPIYFANGFPDEYSFTLNNAPSINEQLAFSAGLSLLRAFVLADENEAERHQYFIGKDIFVPPIFRGQDTNSYDFGTLMGWSLFDANVVNGLSIPLLADIYFLLDRYHEAQFKLNELRAAQSI
jgi:hypothetical protein